MLMRWNDLGFGPLAAQRATRSAAFSGLSRELDQLFAGLDSNWSVEAPVRALAPSRTAAPQFRVNDSGEELRLEAELPGFKQADLEISFVKNTLVINGKRADNVPEGYAVQRKERAQVSFARAFTLPARIDADKIEASLKDGVLVLRLPKIAEEKARAIAIKAA